MVNHTELRARCNATGMNVQRKRTTAYNNKCWSQKSVGMVQDVQREENISAAAQDRPKAKRIRVLSRNAGSGYKEGDCKV